MTNQPPISGLKDNHRRGKVGDFLRGKLRPIAELSFVSAYFTIYAFEAMRAELDQIGNLRFLFGEPRFIQRRDPLKSEGKAFGIADDKLEQMLVARECADWCDELWNDDKLVKDVKGHRRAMAAYSDLSQKAIASFVHTFSRRAVGQILLSLDAILPTRREQATEDFEIDLVTWLVIKEAKA